MTNAREVVNAVKGPSRWQQSLTSDLFSYKDLRNMFLTLALDQFFISFISMLSTAMVSSTGEAAMAAVSMVGTVNGMVSLLFTSLATGGAIVVARAKGSGNAQDVRRSIGETTGLCGAVALVLSLVLYALADVLVNALYPSVEPLLVEYSVHYMRLMSLSFIPYSVFCGVFNSFRSLGDTKSSLILTIIINGAHLLLSLLFINGLHLGVTGAGLSYIVARVVGMVAALYWLLVRYNELGVRMKHFFRFSRAMTRDIFSLGTPIAMESLLMQGGMLLVQIYLAKLTTTDLAAHAVANSILNLYYTTGNALTALAGTVCGQCIGAKQLELTRTYCRNLIRVGRVILLVTMLVMLPCTPLLLMLFGATEQAKPIIWTCLLIAGAFLPVLWCDSYVPPMALRAAGDAVYTSWVSVAALLVSRCVLGYVFTIVLGLGVPGIWIGLVIEWLIRAVLLRMRLRGNKWMKALEPHPSCPQA